MEEDRERALQLLEEGQRKGAPAGAIADLLGICVRSLRRWGQACAAHGFSKDGRKGSPRQVRHRFSHEERKRLIETVNNPRFADLHPAQIVAILAEEKDYVGSESTIYRIMRQEGLLNHRGRSRPPRETREVPVLEVTGIHQVLAWDITLLPGAVKGQFYYLYMVMDVWSRRILGVEVYEEERGRLARDFFDRVCRDEGIHKNKATILHSDNGAPMRSFTLAAKLAELGVIRSFSRPGVSNDNAFAESLFRTLKYHQSYPHRRFRDLPSVRAWVDKFVDWYNNEHRHSGIQYVTPNQRHYGEADEICTRRQETYEKAREMNPQRWSRHPRDWSQPQTVRMNHPRPEKGVTG
ncbi:MAG: IS3 family transposase [Cyanobacteriota bacterium]